MNSIINFSITFTLSFADYSENEDDFILETLDRAMIALKIDVPELADHYKLQKEISDLESAYDSKKLESEKKKKELQRESNKTRSAPKKKQIRKRKEKIDEDLMKLKKKKDDDIKTLQEALELMPGWYIQNKRKDQAAAGIHRAKGQRNPYSGDMSIRHFKENV